MRKNSTNRIKICHVVYPVALGGIETFLCNVLERTDFSKYDVTIVQYSLGAKPSETALSRLNALPVRIVIHPSKNVWDFCRFLNAFFKENNFDVCHSHCEVANAFFLFVALRNGVPIRASHGHTARNPNEKKGLLKKIRETISRWILFRCANRYMACSEEASLFLHGPAVARKRHLIIPNGIDLEAFSNPDRIKHEPTEILFVGRMSQEKNPVFAVQTFAEFLKYDPSARMTMIGRGSLSKEVQAEIERLNLSKRVNLVPQTIETSKFYQAADLLIVPSLYEGLGIVLIEAQASGLKCLASDAIPRLAQCGLVDYRPLADGAKAWGWHLSNLLRDDSLKVDRDKLKYFDINNAVKMIYESYGL